MMMMESVHFPSGSIAASFQGEKGWYANVDYGDNFQTQLIEHGRLLLRDFRGVLWWGLSPCSNEMERLRAKHALSGS